MKTYTHETLVSTSPAKLYAAITDVAAWPRWDTEIEATEAPAAPRVGERFSLKPKGGPRVAMSVEAAEPARRFTDVSHLPLAKMRTSHEFEPTPEGTRVRVTIDVWGPLAFLWDRVVARKQAAGAEQQTRAFVAYAETYG